MERRIGGLDKNLARYKLPIDFEGLPGKWSDIDGHQIYKDKSWITIEEKSFWSARDYECMSINRWTVKNCSAPAIVFYTKSGVDWLKQGYTSVPLKRTFVIDFYTNRPNFLENFAPEYKVPVKKIQHNDLVYWINAWYKFVDGVEKYWLPTSS